MCSARMTGSISAAPRMACWKAPSPAIWPRSARPACSTTSYWSQHYARRWDMTATPAICPHCAVGCNITLYERHGTLRQVQNRYHGAINGFFLCDRGRFGPLFADSDRTDHRRRAIAGLPSGRGCGWRSARAAVAEGAIGIGSPRASLEANFALRRLVGPERFFAGVSDAEAALVARMAAILRRRSGADRDAEGDRDRRRGAGAGRGPDRHRAARRAGAAAGGAWRRAGAGRREGGARLARSPPCGWRARGGGRRSRWSRRSPMRWTTSPPTRCGGAPAGGCRLRPCRGRRAARRARPDADGVAVAPALAEAEAPLIIAGAGLGLAGPVEAAAEIAAALGPRARLALFPPEANSLGLALLGGDGLESAAAALRGPGRAR